MTAAPNRLYGRRKGHRLRVKAQQLIDTLLPRLTLDPAAAGDLPAAFGGDFEQFWLEIGFGKGEHLAAQAAANPHVGLIGCEPFVNGIAGLLDLVEIQRLANVRVFPGDARDLLPALAPAALDRVFVLHPDPWPKARHAKRRLIAPATLDALARVMAPDAELRLGTDDRGYSAWAAMQMARRADFVWLAETAADWTRRPDDWLPTRYEAKAAAAGRRAVYLRYRRVCENP